MAIKKKWARGNRFLHFQFAQKFDRELLWAQTSNTFQFISPFGSTLTTFSKAELRRILKTQRDLLPNSRHKYEHKIGRKKRNEN